MTAAAAPAADGIPPARHRLLVTLFVLYLLLLAGLCAWQHRTLFAWPDGIVTGNLLASAIWAPLAVVHLDRLARRHHREHLALLRRHHQEQMTALGRPGAGGGRVHSPDASAPGISTLPHLAGCMLAPWQSSRPACSAASRSSPHR
jgi:hypothetical protein